MICWNERVGRGEGERKRRQQAVLLLTKARALYEKTQMTRQLHLAPELIVVGFCLTNGIRLRNPPDLSGCSEKSSATKHS